MYLLYTLAYIVFKFCCKIKNNFKVSLSGCYKQVLLHLQQSTPAVAPTRRTHFQYCNNRYEIFSKCLFTLFLYWNFQLFFIFFRFVLYSFIKEKIFINILSEYCTCLYLYLLWLLICKSYNIDVVIKLCRVCQIACHAVEVKENKTPFKQEHDENKSICHYRKGNNRTIRQ